MFIPTVYSMALLLMILSMVCWGSWANTQKATGSWRFELFYWDYVWGILLLSLIAGLTLGHTDPASPESFLRNLTDAGGRNVLLALAGGAIFNFANILLVAAIDIAGLAVAFPIGIGLALVIGSILNYVVTPAGNPLYLFGGSATVCAAIVLDAMAYRKLSGNVQVTTKGIVLSLLAGIFMGIFYPFIAKAMKGSGHLGPYTVMFVFALGILISNLPMNYALMRRPITGAPAVSLSEYFAARGGLHVWGVLGGVIWAVGTVSNFVASYAQMVGPATSYALGQGATMVSALWGVFMWREFRGAGPAATRLLTLMFVFFIIGLAGVALAPVIK